MEGLEKALNQLVEVGVGAPHPFNLTYGVDDSGMMFSAESFTDVGEAGFGKVLGHVHGDLAREGHGLGIVASLEVCDLEAVVVSDVFLDHVHADDPAFVG